MRCDLYSLVNDREAELADEEANPYASAQSR
jgi:hypothetical protein